MIAPIPINQEEESESMILSRRETWEEHQRRQRSIRMLMMFLMMLILMDGEEPHSRKKTALRGKKKKRFSSLDKNYIPKDLWRHRVELDDWIGKVGRDHERYQEVIDLNNGTDVQSHAMEWAERSVDKDRNATDAIGISGVTHRNSSTNDKDHGNGNDNDADNDDDDRKKQSTLKKHNLQQAQDAFDKFQEEETLVHHYPRNATGSYRGTWKRVITTGQKGDAFLWDAVSRPWANVSSYHRLEDADEKMIQKNENSTGLHVVLSDEQVANLLPSNHIGLHLLPPNTRLDEIVHHKKNGGSSSSFDNQTNTIEMNDSSTLVPSLESNHSLDVTKDDGSIVIRLYTRAITGMNEVSLVDGVVVLYDVNDRSFTSQMKHLTLRVRGIVLHSLGRISLVANDGPLRSVFVVKNGNGSANGNENENEIEGDVDGRNLMAESSIKTNETGAQSNVERLRNQILRDHNEFFRNEIGGENWTQYLQYGGTGTSGSTGRKLQSKNTVYVGANPFLPDDRDGTLFATPSNILRATSPLARQNGLGCEFELDLNITATPWKLVEWRNLLKNMLIHKMRADPYRLEDQKNGSSTEVAKQKFMDNQLTTTKEANAAEDFVMHMMGTLRSQECNFVSSLNVTAIRTDWERASSKAINYCFFMMIACLAQTVFLLRQMIFSQAQSAAVRMSIFTVGWQTVLDAILCVEHILLCLLLQPVSTAFAMVAFLKLLLFCVIEMKYMVMIMQARLNAAGVTLSSTDLRRRVTTLHFRFYVVLITTMAFLWHLREKHRTLCLLGMYSFWIPQILQSIITETKSPLHKHYIYGMTASRLIAPLYTLAFPNNFFIEIEPDFPVDYFSCKMLILWVALQVSILAGQAKYGPRFMIPARFLPPKYDYHRPIPGSLIPKPTLARIASRAEEAGSSPLLENEVIGGNETLGPRKRKEKRVRNSNDNNTSSATISCNERFERPTLDCVICYNEIDIGHRSGYMLAPCNHIFHTDCLVQWMEVKMECPVCRTDLPAL